MPAGGCRGGIEGRRIDYCVVSTAPFRTTGLLASLTKVATTLAY
jgi:hypothetical protein